MQSEILMFIFGVIGYSVLTFTRYKEIALWSFLFSNLIFMHNLWMHEQYWGFAMICVYFLFCIIGIIRLSRDKVVSSNHENDNNRTNITLNVDRKSIPRELRNRFGKH